MKMPAISVVMGTYNCAPYLDVALGSVACQTFEDWELIIVDDGSTDESPQLLARWASRDSRIRVIRQPNSGRPGVPRNRGIGEARGAILTFLDGDDAIHPDRFAQIVRGFADHPERDVIYHDYVRFREAPVDYAQTGFLRASRYVEQLRGFSEVVASDPPTYAPSDYLFLFFATSATGVLVNTVAIRRRILERLPGPPFPEQYLAAEDTHLWLRLAQSGLFLYIDGVWSGYRERPGSVMESSAAAAERAAAFLQVKGAALQVAEQALSPRHRREHRARIGDAWRGIGWRCQEAGLRPEARIAYVRSLWRARSVWEISRSIRGLVAVSMPRVVARAAGITGAAAAVPRA